MVEGIVRRLGGTPHSYRFPEPVAVTDVKPFLPRAAHLAAWDQRPGLLRGRREEVRVLEGLAMLLAPLIDPLLSGSWRRFHSIRVEVLAQAIFALAREKAGGRFVHDYDSLLRAIRRAGIDTLRG